MKNPRTLTIQGVLDIIAEHLGIESDLVKVDQPLSSLPMDSLDYLDLIVKLEDVTGISVTRKNLTAFENVGDLADFFERAICPK